MHEFIIFIYIYTTYNLKKKIVCVSVCKCLICIFMYTKYPFRLNVGFCCTVTCHLKYSFKAFHLGKLIQFSAILTNNIKIGMRNSKFSTTQTYYLFLN